ncbi:unnamed protein product [Caenorhabditis auriculariae]|uniref:Protein kinase domain-containing protein n=1 Tax=Caenorhabditis auriculariae TaxID=2777116 RepID=A0A8S1GW91_9PELO|nr:unnamed protein product [Caenorhabditis auriculariae]
MTTAPVHPEASGASELLEENCSASYMTPYATVVAMTSFYLLALFCFCKNGKKMCLPVADSIYPYAKRMKQLERELQHLIVDDENIEIEDFQLGQGHFGFVFKGGVFPKTQKRYKQRVNAAVKMSFPIVKKSICLLEEAARMSRLQHPNIVRLIAVSRLSFSVLRPLIVIEWLPGGSLAEFFKNHIRNVEERQQQTVSLTDMLSVMKQISEALTHIHECLDAISGLEMTHGDVAARNVLLSSQDISRCVAKLGDFGVPPQGGLQPVAWLPPEVLCSTDRFPRHLPECDVWMFGVFMWECLTLGAEPHYQKSLEEIKRSFRLPDRGLACPPGCPLDVVSSDGLYVRRALSTAFLSFEFVQSVDSSAASEPTQELFDVSRTDSDVECLKLPVRRAPMPRHFFSIGPPFPIARFKSLSVKGKYWHEEPDPIAAQIESATHSSRRRRRRTSEDVAHLPMSETSLNVQKGSWLCAFSHRATSIVFSALQFGFSVIIGLIYKLKLERSVIVNILFGIHMTCAAVALLFLIFCIAKRKLGTFYEILLYTYLLTILLMGLTSLFGVMYVPLSFIQSAHTLSEGKNFNKNRGIDYFLLFLSTFGMFALQFLQKNLTEQMLPVMEHTFK